MPVCQAKRSCTLREFARWVEYSKFEPWGEERADLRACVITAKMHNLWSSGKTLSPYDLMSSIFNFDKQVKVQTVEEQQAGMARSFANLRKAQKRGNPNS